MTTVLLLACFLLDLIAHNLLQSWVVFLLPAYGATLLFTYPLPRRSALALGLLLIVLQDFLIYNHLGLCLLTLLPLVAGALAARHYIIESSLFPSLFFCFYLLASQILSKRVVFGRFPGLFSTLWPVFVTLAIAWCVYVLGVIFGMWGNRSKW